MNSYRPPSFALTIKPSRGIRFQVLATMSKGTRSRHNTQEGRAAECASVAKLIVDKRNQWACSG